MASLYDKVARCYITVCEMVADRGILNEDELRYMRAFGRDEIIGMAKSGSIFTIDINDTLCVMFYTSRFKLADFKPYIKKADNFQHAIVVLAEKPSPANIKFINARERRGDASQSTSKTTPLTPLQVFVIPELLFNITRHRLVPKHEVISDADEIANITKRYNIRTRTQLPIILRTDPVARYLGLKPGQLVKITRVSPSAGLYTTYRYCV